MRASRPPVPGGVPLPELTRSARRLWLALGLLALLMAGAVLFYTRVESRLSGAHWTLVDGIYMAVLTVTTIGFSEVHPLSKSGELFTSGFALAGILLLAGAARSAVELALGEQISAELQRRRRLKTLSKLENHYLVCGFGRMGREVVRLLSQRRLPMAVIEQDPALAEELQQSGIPFVQGNATHDANLLAAGIQRAKGLVAVTATDEDNLFIVLSARVLNPKLYIVSRASTEASIEKLKRAGADRVLSPYVVGAHQIAHAVIQPGVVDFLELVLHSEELDLEIGGIEVQQGWAAADRPMRDTGICCEGGAVILAVRDRQGHFRTNPSANTVVSPGELLIAMGTRDQLGALERMARG